MSDRETCKLPLSSQTVAQKRKFAIFANKTASAKKNLL